MNIGLVFRVSFIVKPLLLAQFKHLCPKFNSIVNKKSKFKTLIINRIFIILKVMTYVLMSKALVF